jgi:hypothetical protein
MATPNCAAGCVAGEATISRVQHHISASHAWHAEVPHHSRRHWGFRASRRGSSSWAPCFFACLERVHHACREEPATPIMRSLQGIVRVLHAGYCHASGQPLRRTLSFHQRFHRHRAHKRGGHQCGACTILVEIRADERCAGLIGALGRMCGLHSKRALLWRTHPTTSCRRNPGDTSAARSCASRCSSSDLMGKYIAAARLQEDGTHGSTPPEAHSSE